MEEDSETTLVVAGDLHVGMDVCDALTEMSTRFKDVVYVLGNHEFYRNEMTTLVSDIKEELSDFTSIHVLDDEVVVLDGVRFVGSTLWTDMDNRNPVSMLCIEQGMTDYHVIRKNGFPARAMDTIALHAVAVNFLHETLAEAHEGPTVVVTHHLPSMQSVAPMFRHPDHNQLNGGYCSNLDDMLVDYDVEYWFHGHTHATVEYDVDGTKVRMNPFGYSGHAENEDFDPEWRVEV